MSRIQNRYASAVRSSNLKSRPETVQSDADVLGAYGIADRRLAAGTDQLERHPLSVPLERLFTGDRTAARQIVEILAGIVRGRANAMRVDVSATQSADMARAIVAWYRNGACRVCGGHGFKVIPGTKTLGDSRCWPCLGTGKIQLELEFREELRELVRWAMARVEREAGRAGPAALKALAPLMNLE